MNANDLMDIARRGLAIERDLDAALQLARARDALMAARIPERFWW